MVKLSYKTLFLGSIKTDVSWQPVSQYADFVFSGQKTEIVKILMEQV